MHIVGECIIYLYQRVSGLLRRECKCIFFYRQCIDIVFILQCQKVQSQIVPKRLETIVIFQFVFFKGNCLFKRPRFTVTVFHRILYMNPVPGDCYLYKTKYNICVCLYIVQQK